MLYLPRGFVHQAECSATTHSDGATVSSNQSNAPADALEIAVTNALAAFVRATPRARKNLPRDRSSEAYIDARRRVSRIASLPPNPSRRFSRARHGIFAREVYDAAPY